MQGYHHLDHPEVPEDIGIDLATEIKDLRGDHRRGAQLPNRRDVETPEKDDLQRGKRRGRG